MPDYPHPKQRLGREENLGASPKESSSSHSPQAPSYSLQTLPHFSGMSYIEPILRTSTPSLLAFKSKPTNFFTLSTGDNTIRGEFVINPTLRIPSSMLLPQGKGETEDDRKNLSLSSTYGSVHAKIWLLGDACSVESAMGVPVPRRTTIALNADHGSIDAALHTLDGATPFSLTACATHGPVCLALPRSFQGHLSLFTRSGSIFVSDALMQNATQFSQLGHTRRYFVGDFAKLGEGEWEGDQVKIDTLRGSVRVRYIDEIAAVVHGKEVLSRLLAKL